MACVRMWTLASRHGRKAPSNQMKPSRSSKVASVTSGSKYLFYVAERLWPVTFCAKYVNMADALLHGSVPGASPLFLREAEIRRGIELLYFGYSNMIRGADAMLDVKGLGRAHHRWRCAA